MSIYDIHEYRVSYHIILIYVTVIILSENYFKNVQRDIIIFVDEYIKLYVI